jgi:hypothetical protein
MFGAFAGCDVKLLDGATPAQSDAVENRGSPSWRGSRDRIFDSP